MQESKQQAPHFYVQTEVRMDSVLAHISELKKSGLEVTVTAALARACALALREVPQFNSVWTEAGLLQVDAVNLGIAISLEDGLLAPALLDADQLSLLEIVSALRDLGARARSQKLRPRELSEATFTLSNLGMFDISAFAAIITPPQVAVLATARPIVRYFHRDGAPATISLMTATLSADHRAVDGSDAARFLTSFKIALEAPERLIPDTSIEPKEMIL
jgi:pyruvate dehydrogenase E2 component (dihydrolipoamide acetyltransferase)